MKSSVAQNQTGLRDEGVPSGAGADAVGILEQAVVLGGSRQRAELRQARIVWR